VVRIRCQCGKSLKLPADQVNRSASCPQCRSRVRIVVAEATIEEGKLKGRLTLNAPSADRIEQIFLGGRGPIEVGKAEGAHLRLLAQSVSRRHCRLVHIERGWRIEDLGSTNGLYINGHRVKGHNLLHGDLVRVGNIELHYSYEPTRHAQSSAAVEEAAAINASISHTAFPDSSAALALNFLDDTAALEATAAAPAIAAKAVSSPGGGTADPTDDLFQFAAEDDDGPPISLPVDAPRDVARSCPNCQATVAPGTRICVSCGTDLATGRRLETDADVESFAASTPSAGGSLVAYLKDCLWSFALIFRFGNLVKFLILSLAAAFSVFLLFSLGLSIRPSLFWLMRMVASVAAAGWVCSYLFNVVESAAYGDDELPSLSFDDGWWDDGVVPFFKSLFIAVLVHVPAITYAGAVGASWFAAAGGPDPVLEGLLWLRALLWPFAVLLASVGGMESFLRPDLVLRSIARSFLPYLAACGMTALALGAASFAANTAGSGRVLFGGSTWATISVLLVISMAFWIVSMRCIGLYYHHFKDRFAWAWG